MAGRVSMTEVVRVGAEFAVRLRAHSGVAGGAAR